MTDESTNCDAAMQLIDRLVDGEATADERREALAHLQTCESCQNHERFVNALSPALSQHRPASPPESYFDSLPAKILARIEDVRAEKERSKAPLAVVAAHDRRGKSTRIGSSIPVWLVPAAAAVVILVVGKQVFELAREPVSTGDVTSTPERIEARSPEQPAARQMATDAATSPAVSSAPGLRAGADADATRGLRGVSAGEEASAQQPSAAELQSESPHSAVHESSDPSPSEPPPLHETSTPSLLSSPPSDVEPRRTPRVAGRVEEASTGVVPPIVESYDDSAPAAIVSSESVDEQEQEDPQAWAAETRTRRRVSSDQLGADAQQLARAGEAETGSESARATTAARRPRSTSASPAPPAGASALQLKSDSATDLVVETRALRARSQSLSVRPTVPIGDWERLCDDWDGLAVRSAGTSSRGESLYEAAMCHDALFRLDSGAARKTALADALERYLAHDSDSERAEAILNLLDGLR